MRGVALTGALLLALCLSAQADPSSAPAADPFAAEYGNTLTQTGPDGARITTYINEDHSWEQHLPDGSVRHGTYRWQDDHTVCFEQTDPTPQNDQGAGCHEVQSAHQVGESWTQNDSKGKAYTMSIVAGRHE